MGSIIHLRAKCAASSRALINARSYVCYTRPDAIDKTGEDFNAPGRFSRSVLHQLGLPRDADIYLCGPTQFMADMKEALTALGVAPDARASRDLQRRRVHDPWCGRRTDASSASA